MKYLTLILVFNASLSLYSQTLPVNVNRTRAVVIGVSDYQDKKVENLEYAAKAALAYAAYLKSSPGGKIDDSDIRLLINKDATAGRMVASMDWLMDAGKEGDRAIFYFAGYGSLQSLIPYDIPQSAMNASVFPFERTKRILSRLTKAKKMELVIIADVFPPFSSENISIKENKNVRSDSLKAVNEVIISSASNRVLSSSAFYSSNGYGLTNYLLDGLLGRADFNNDREVSLRETQKYLQWKIKLVPVNPGILYIYTDTLNRPFSRVEAGVLTQLKKDKHNILPPIVNIDPEHFENSLLINEEETTRRLYQDFVVAIRLGYLLSPENLSAEYLYGQLLNESEQVPLQRSAMRKFAAALQDESQQAINAYLKTDPNELQIRWEYSEKYSRYPLYLEKAAALLGERHYLYNHLLAKQMYFEGVAMRLDAEKSGKKNTAFQGALQKQEEALGYEDQAAFIYNEIGLLYDKMGMHKKAIENYLIATELSPQWSIPYSNLCITYGLLQQWKTAEDYGQKAIALKPDYATAYNNLGTIYVGMNRFKTAEKHLKKAIRLLPESPSAYYNMACSKALRGKPSASMRWLEKAFEKGFKDYEHLRQDSDLHSLTDTPKYQRLVENYFPD